jgi:hypothetical protein
MRRAARIALAAALAAAAAACAQLPKTPALGPTSATFTGDTVDVVAGGREISVAPPEGFCVDEASVSQRPDAVFMLIEDCAQLGRSDRSAGVSGLVTLTLGAEALFPQGGPPAAARTGIGRDGPAAASASAAAAVSDKAASFRALEDYLRTEEGRATAGMGGTADQIRVVEARRTEDTLYVLVEDKGEQVLPVLGPRFWRGFTEVNGRAAIASLGVFATDEIADATMLAHLVEVIAALKLANGDRVLEDEAELARPLDGGADLASRSASGAAPGRAPGSKPRPGS